jgi:hypothetical protein
MSEEYGSAGPERTRVLRIIGWIEISGALYGLWALVGLHQPTVPVGWGPPTLAGLVCFYFVSLFGGILLIRMTPWGVRVSIGLQFVQSVWLRSNGFEYLLYSGACFFLRLFGIGDAAQLQIGSGFTLRAAQQDAPPYVAINVFSVCLLALLLRNHPKPAG